MSMTWTIRRVFLSFALTLVLVSAPFAHADVSALSCAVAIKRAHALERVHYRVAIVRHPPHRTLFEWLRFAQLQRKVSFIGQHSYVPGYEFLASNEFDWFNTPLDGKPTDLMIAFGTNSFWEIAVNKNAKKVILADWSPNPILAHTYLIAPLMRISDSAAEFALHLSGEIPTVGPNSRMSIESVLKTHSGTFILDDHKVDAYLHYLASRTEIRDDELEFLSAYFWSRTGGLRRAPSPFFKLQRPDFADFTSYFHDRYADATPQQLWQSALHNPSLFQKLRSMFNENRVEFAIAEVSDPAFYSSVLAQNPSAQNITLSLTNIFDVPYAGHTFQSLQRMLDAFIKTAGISDRRPLTVFRTTNDRPPHGFHRYDIRGPGDIPSIDEPGSKARHERRPPRVVGQ